MNYLDLQQGKTYRLSFDARSSSENFLYAKIWKSQDGWAQFFWDQFEIKTTMQRYSTEFTRNEADTKMGQLLFDFTGNGDEYWIDNVSFCEVTEEEVQQITFRVDMQNEEVSSEGVFMIGDWDPDNQWVSPVQMTADGSVYSITLELAPGTVFEYKFKNGSEWELPAGDCVNAGTSNRIYTVQEADTEVPAVCYNSCTACGTNVTGMAVSLAAISFYPNPTRGIITLEGLPADELKITLYDMKGRRVFQDTFNAEPVLEIDLGSYQPGIYALSVQSPVRSESVTWRVVKE